MNTQPSVIREVEDRFVLHWGEMAQTWGINKTMGQVHGLLFVTGREWDAEEIVERLRVSRGNVSVTLRALIDWGLVRRFHKPGERREYFVSVSDVDHIFRTIVAERKRREFDPTRRAVEALVESTPQSPEGQAIRERLADLRALLATLDQAFERFSSGSVAEAAQVLKVDIEGLG